MQTHNAVVFILAALVAAACSSQSQSAKPEVVAQAPAAGGLAAGGTAGAAGAPTAASTPAAGAAPTGGGGVDQSLVKDGYRVVRRPDKILYCRTQGTTGTRFTTTVCMTADQIAVLKRDSQDSKDALAKTKPSGCLGNTCNN